MVEMEGGLKGDIAVDEINIRSGTCCKFKPHNNYDE